MSNYTRDFLLILFLRCHAPWAADSPLACCSSAHRNSRVRRRLSRRKEATAAHTPARASPECPWAKPPGCRLQGHSAPLSARDQSGAPGGGLLLGDTCRPAAEPGLAISASSYLRSHYDDLRQLDDVGAHRVEDVLQFIDDRDQRLHDSGNTGPQSSKPLQ